MIKRGLIVILVLIFLFSTTILAQEKDFEGGNEVEWGEADFSDPNTDLTDMESGDIADNLQKLSDNNRLGDSKLNQEELGKALRDKGYSGVESVDLAGSDATIDGDVLSVNGNTVDLGTFKSGSHVIDASGDSLVIDGNTMMGASNVHLEDGVVSIDFVERFVSDSVTVSDGVNVRVLGDGMVEGESAWDLAVGSREWAGNVENFVIGPSRVMVETADYVFRDCLQFVNVSNAEFEFGTSTTARLLGTTMQIKNCQGKELSFTALGNGTLNIQDDTYSITNANLSYEDTEYIEWIQATNGALIIMDEHYGFSCMTIMPGGTYFYSSKIDKRVDQSVESPEPYGIDYRLCIKKDNSQTFTNFDGIIDLVNNFNVLDSTVNYYRYPLRNNVLAGVVLQPVYQAFLNPKMKMRLDTYNIYSTNMTVTPHSSDKTVSKTIASNYLTIRESPSTKDRNTRTWTKINHILEKEELTDN